MLNFPDNLLADHQLVKQLASQLTPQAKVLHSGSEGWAEAVMPFNQDAQNQVPALIVQCAAESDVSACVMFARQNNMPLTPRSGRHNLAGFSLLHGGIIIDVHSLKKISHSTEEGTVTYQSGCRFGDVDKYLEANLPGWVWVTANDPSIGTAGCRTSLGVGWLHRWFGNGIDNLVSARVVLADGKIVVANKQENPDLFFALKGAGANFGIVTQFTEKMHYVVDPKQGKQVLFSQHFFPIDVVQEVYDAVLALSLREDLPDQVFILPILCQRDGQRGMRIQCYHYKYDPEKKEINKEEHWVETEFRRLVTKYKAVSKNLYGNEDGWGYISHHLLQTKVNTIPWGLNFYPCGGFISREKASQVTSALIKHWREAKSPQFKEHFPFVHTFFYSFGGKGQINRDPQSTAWPGNDQTQILSVSWAQWRDPVDKPKLIKWVKEQWAPIIKDLQWGYICAAAFDWKSKAHAKWLYGDNYDRLTQIKRRYDPANIFRHNINIPPASSD